MKLWRWTKTDTDGVVTIEIQAPSRKAAKSLIATIIWEGLGDITRGKLRQVGPVPSEGE